MSIDLSQASQIYFFARIAQYAVERTLSLKNYKYTRDPARLEAARQVLNLTQDDIEKTLSYAEDRFRFSSIVNAVSLLLTLGFLANGGLGYIERAASMTLQQVLPSAAPANPILIGMVFFGILGILSMAMSLPFDYYNTFVIEQKHGFNRQTQKQFIADRCKGLILGVILGAPILALILWIMGSLGQHWWIAAWAVLSLFSILTSWIYPTLLAPLFNKFTALEPGPLKEQIDRLANATGFKSDGIFLMDASKRSGHGNAYFTGIFGKKRIVLFDTLIQSLKVEEIVSVLAHELGHFKLKHVFWGLMRGLVQSAGVFYLLSLCLPLEPVYQSFGLVGRSDYGALIVFGVFLGLMEFVIQPFEHYLSRRNEFAADQFALKHSTGTTHLAEALLKLRETSRSLPISHPVFSKFYYTHPPLIERLAAMGYPPAQKNS